MPLSLVTRFALFESPAVLPHRRLRTVVFRTFLPEQNAHRPLPFRVTPQITTSRRGSGEICLLSYPVTLRDCFCFRRGNTHQFGVTFSPKDCISEASKAPFGFILGCCSASQVDCPLSNVCGPPFRAELQSRKNRLQNSPDPS